MTFSLDNLLESVVPAIISGGGTAMSTIFAFFRDLKKRIEDLEKRVGSVDNKFGLAFSVSLVEESVRQVRNQIEGMNNGRWTRPSMTGIEGFPSLPNLDQALQRVMSIEPRLRELEERCERIENKFKKLVTEEDFEQSDRQRAEEIATVRTTLAEVKGLLQGLQSALGLIKSR
jgi:DNA repair exonuclease SbcCD ATPase subunit